MHDSHTHLSQHPCLFDNYGTGRRSEKNGLELLAVTDHASMLEDAYFSGAVGDFKESRELLESVRFPKELVANTSVLKYLDLMEERKRNG